MKSLKYYANYYLPRATLPYWTILLMDCATVLLSELFTFSLHYGLPTTFHNFGSLALTLGVFFACFVASPASIPPRQTSGLAPDKDCSPAQRNHQRLLATTLPHILSTKKPFDGDMGTTPIFLCIFAA